MRLPFSDRWHEAVKQFSPQARVDASKEGDVHELGLYGVIGDVWPDTGITEAKVLAVVPENGDMLRVRINSPGGNPHVAMAIGSALRARAKHLIVTVDGLAASAASVLAMFADEIEMGVGSQIMIHAPSMIVAGNADDIRAAIVGLESVGKGMADLYAGRVGAAEAARLTDPQTGETWYGAQEAVDAKLADRVITIEPRKSDDDNEKRRRKTSARLRLAIARSRA